MSKIRAGLLLLVSALAMSAFVAPAVAQAEGPFWYVNGEKLEGEEAIEAEGELTFSTSTSGLQIDIGPCEFTFIGTIENGGEGASGEIEYSTLLGDVCDTTFSMEGKSAKCNTEVFVGNFGWPITVTESGISFDGVAFSAKFHLGCPLGNSFAWSGTLQGGWDNPSNSFVFEEAGEMSGPPPAELPVTTNGELQVSAEGGPVTLE